ncbi:MAG: tannase/feruloyl esterase family alpha/beta hydrolase [Pseudomonadota bacterium]
MPRLKLSGAALACLALQAAAPQANAQQCEALLQLALPDVRIDAATAIAVGGWQADAARASTSPDALPGGVAVNTPFCRIEGTLEKEIGFELWLPNAGRWNGKLLGAGVGGDAGAFNLRDLPRGVARGYAAATTDTGHKVGDRLWMLGDPVRLANYTHRANHLLALAAKAIVASYYRKPARHAYFIGCSGGGRQALKEMQMYPDDYDGIVAGAPGPRTDLMTARRMWEIVQHRNAPGLMSDADWQLVAEHGARRCDRQDGVADGVAENPQACRLDAASLLCKPGQASACLNQTQLDLVQRIYAPLRDEQGRQLDDGLLPGVRIKPLPESRLAPATFGQAVHRDPDWNSAGFSLARDLPGIAGVMPELAADRADLAAFRARGGKAIVYQGWLDPAVPAQMVSAYGARVQQAMGGADAAGQFFRLFMAPGVFHCGGGPGPDQFGGAGADAPVPDAAHDMLSALEAWVEQGRAPEVIIASKVEQGKVVRTRPLCPYPQAAHYRGSGSTDNAASFYCAAQR